MLVFAILLRFFPVHFIVDDCIAVIIIVVKAKHWNYGLGALQFRVCNKQTNKQKGKLEALSCLDIITMKEDLVHQSSQVTERDYNNKLRFPISTAVMKTCFHVLLQNFHVRNDLYSFLSLHPEC